MAQIASSPPFDAFPGWDVDLRGPVGPRVKRQVRGDRVWLDDLATRPRREAVVDLEECRFAYAEIVVGPDDGPDHHETDGFASRARSHLQDCFVWVGIPPDQATAAAVHCLASPTPAIPSYGPDAPAALPGWDAMDVWLFTSVSLSICKEACPHNVRVARVLVGPEAFICVWRNVRGVDPWPEEYPRALPQRLRRHSWTVELSGGTPRDEAARLIQDVLQHHEWFATQLEKRVENWERTFYSDARSPGSLFSGIQTRRLVEDLGSIAEASLELREACRDLERRGRLAFLSAPAAIRVELQGEIDMRSAALAARMVTLRADVRDAFGLLANAASGEQVELQQSFTNVVTIVTALVLIPTLVVGLYGTTTAGLPGFTQSRGLLYVGGYAGIGAAATLVSLLAMRRRTCYGNFVAGAVWSIGIVIVVLMTVYRWL